MQAELATRIQIESMFDSILVVLGKDFEKFNNILLRPLLLIAGNSPAKLWMIDEVRVEKSYNELKKRYALGGKSREHCNMIRAKFATSYHDVSS